MTEEPLSTHRELELLRDLQRLANQRHASEQKIAGDYASGAEAATTLCKQQIEQANKEFEEKKGKLESEYEATTGKLTSDYESQRDATQGEYRDTKKRIEATYETRLRESKDTQKQSAWQALAEFDAAKNSPRDQLEEVQAHLAARRGELDQIHAGAVKILRERHLWSKQLEQLAPSANGEATPQVAGEANFEQSRAAIEKNLAEAQDQLQKLYDHRASSLFEGPGIMGVLLVVLLLVALPTVAVMGWASPIAWVAGVVGGLLVGAVVGFFLWRSAGRWVTEAFQSLTAKQTAAVGQMELCAIAARERSRRQAQQLLESRDQELAAADAEFKKNTTQLADWKSVSLEEANTKFPAVLSRIREENQSAIAREEQDRSHTLSVITATREKKIADAEVLKKQTLAQLETDRDTAFNELSDAWHAGFAAIADSVMSLQKQCARLFPDWHTTDYAEWEKPSQPTAAIQFGTSTLDLAKVKHAISRDERLKPPATEFKLPALITLLEQPSLVTTAEGDGRSRGIHLLQTLMVRYLTAMPPGKVRFTICDTLGLGESFSSFMHLADFDEGLINGRIWSEARDIDQQLTRLTTHMETILQKYLRSEYDSIHEYNAQASEVAEPFQVLAIANFPHGFTDNSARRLLSLVTGGPRCGIYVLLTLDRRQRLPNDFSTDDLLSAGVHLDWSEEKKKFLWRYPAFEHLPLSLPEPLEGEKLVRLVKLAGQQAKDSIRVEVPFSVVAPEKEEMWTGHCDSELAIPIGRAGANRLHYVKLGKGTSQHLLVAGKTGSGKSTFLHALVTSGAMHFSPKELEFYLVDFKKGVEFKSYATHALPHARVIAIESEREFGISVLQRLDEELKARGEKFRAAGVQNLADYRKDHPDEAVPRVLLVVDEFQELFVEDDRLAQQAGLLLDRLVRQGRAFGMHVLLGSQTLSGAYSLARSTLGQMAVRVALQCSEADAHLILSDERNQAARFLSRPGEAIYNDQNGLVAANQPFQVVWLPDRERAGHLATVAELRDERGLAPREAIVFEGNAPADPTENRELVQLLRGEREASATSQQAWLGSAVAIKPPLAARFSRHAGSNLIMVGQQAATSLGVLSTAIVSLAAANRDVKSDLPTFFLLDGTRPGEPGEGVWQKVADALGPRSEVVSQRDTPGAIGRIASELARREEENDESAPPIYLMVFNASRFRDLRKGEDDFSFSIDKDKPPAVDKQFGEILKNGPNWGIHSLVWCDSYNAVTRLFDRLAMREFEMRIALQMSAADSSNLLDSAEASKLSAHRALLYNDETGESEKFRPYGMPEDDWLAQVKTSLG